MPPDRGRVHTECAAIYDVLLRLKLTTTERHAECKAMLNRTASMLTKMAKNLEGNACAKPTPRPLSSLVLDAPAR